MEHEKSEQQLVLDQVPERLEFQSEKRVYI